MRYEDASHTGAISQGSEPNARNDADSLAAGAHAPATGNLITGEGTQTGPSGADSAAGGHITSIAGASGQDSSFAGGKLQVTGEFGRLSVDAEGNYSYLAKAGTPENSRDHFTYTLADSQGNSDTATLTIDIGKTPAVIKANAQQVVPGPDGVVTLPPGVELSDVHVVGRNLVIDLPGGGQMVIVDGAVFVPQLVLNGVEVPATNLAALLVGSEPQPAAGDQPSQSSGGNFEVPVGPLDPGVPLGDLIPPTENHYIPPEVKEVIPGNVDREPEVLIQPDGQPASVSATDSVDEKGLPARNEGEPEGSGEAAAVGGNGDPSEATAGTIIINSPDGVEAVTINGVVVTGTGQEITGAFGTLRITSVSDSAIGYIYTLGDNTTGDTTHDNFNVTLVDDDGDIATASLVINIIDDEPTARPDTDNIPAGDYGPAVGNIITDTAAGDTGDGDTGADTVGADDAGVTAITGFGTTQEVGGGFVVNGQFGVLTIDADGNYSYVRNQGTPGSVTDVFNYTLTDGDGDTSSSTLTIDIDSLQPETGVNPTAQLDDDALVSGIPGGVGDDTDAANLTGFLAASGGDGPLSFDLLLTGAPAGFSYVDGPAGAVQVMQGGTHVLTITIDPDTGEYQVSQVNPIDHVAGGDENNAFFTVSYRVTDIDGDSADGSLTIDVDDDTPVMARTELATPVLAVDETNLSDNATADFSVAFDGAFGADGPGTTSYALEVVDGTSTGLIDTATGQGIFLFNNGGVVEGHVGNDIAGPLAFTASVDSATGIVTLDQLMALEHPDAADPDDPVSPDADSIQLTATIIDSDGDPASLALNIGSSLAFEDDGPSVTPSGAEPQLIVDESDLTTNETQNFGDAFDELFGADGPDSSNSVSYALGINAGATGLVDTLSNEAVVLSLNGDVVEGRTEIGGDLVFTLAVNADGDVTVDQLRAVVHADPNSPNDSISLANDDLITLTAITMDGDGDTASAAIGIGSNIVLNDDGPSIVAGGQTQELTVDETNLATDDTANFGGLFTAFFGADGPKDVDDNDIADADAITYDLSISSTGADSGLVDTLSGETVLLFLNGGVVEGRTAIGNLLVFTISANGAGDVTLDQIRAVVHPDATDPDTSEGLTLSSNNLVVLTATVTDGDGDQASDSAAIGQSFNFLDDGPSVIASGDQPALLVDETVLALDATQNFAGAFTPNFGSDGPGATPVGYALGVGAGPSGLVDTATGQAVILSLAGGVVEGRTESSNDLVFTVSVDSSGNVTLDQSRAVVHDDPNDPDEAASPAQLASDGLVTLTATVTDGDGDHGSATINIGQNLSFEDDGPTIVASPSALPSLTVDETDFTTNASANLATNFTSIFGNDGFKDVDSDDSPDADAISYALGVGAGPSGLVDTATGQAVILLLTGGVVEGRTESSNDLVFTVSVDSLGIVTLDQSRAIIHDDPNDPDEAITPAQLAAANLITLTATVTDGDLDQDSATIDIGLSLNFEDDGPSAVDDADSIIGGAGPATGNVITGIDILGGDANATDGVADSAGADTPGTITRIASENNGTSDTSFDASNNLVIAGEFGDLTINKDGSYSYLRTDLTATGASDVFTYTLTDGDGDSVTATLTIGIEDNFPNAGTVDVQVDDDAVLGAGGNADGPNDDADATHISGNLPGSGGDAPLTWAFLFTGAPAGFTFEAGAANQLLVKQGLVTVLTVTITDAATGAYTVVQNAPIAHDPQDGTGTDNTENNVQFAITYTVTDTDGDPAEGTINIDVDDDTPTVTNLGSQPTLVVDETILATDDTQSFAGAFTVSFGADGAAVADPLVYTLGVVVGPSGLVDTATGQSVILSLNGGVVEGHTVVGGDLVFTVSVAANGDVTLNQLRSVVHNDPADPDEAGPSAATLADNLITLTAAATDKDGDATSASINIGQNLHFEDDGPSAVASGTDPILTVDETLLTTDASASFASLFTTAYGTDGAGTTAYALNVSASGVASGLFDVASGQQIFLFKVNDGLVEGRVGGSGGAVSFNVSVNGAGLMTLNQVLAIQHLPNTGPDQPISMTTDSLITLSAVVTDGDGDIATASFNIASNLVFEDDAPSAFNPQDVTLTNAAGSPVFFQLDPIANGGDNNILNNFGADGPGFVRFPSTIDNTDSGLTSGAVKIWYILDPTGQVLLGKTGADAASAEASGATIFTIAIDQANSRYSVDMDGRIDALETINFNDGTYDFVGGNATWAGFVPTGQKESGAPINDDSQDLLLTPIGVGTAVNGNANSAGVTGGLAGQNIGSGEGMRLDFIEDLTGTPTPGDYNDVAAEQNHDFDAHYLINGATLKFDQGTSPLTTCSFKAILVTPEVIDDNGDDGTADLVDGTGTLVSVVRIIISYDGENQVVDFDPLDLDNTQTVTVGNAGGLADRIYSVHFVQSGGEWYAEVTGVYDGLVRIATIADQMYNALELLHLGPATSNADFAISGFGAAAQSTDPVLFNLPLEIVDKDGDIVAATDVINFTLNPAVTPVALDTSGDGTITFLDRSAGVAYDYNGNGIAEATAWVGGGDAILVRDANGDGTVTNAAEFIFGGNGLTDMQALAAQYGGTIDADDADFGQFKLWTDANLNGVADAGELQSLSAAGIASIGLVSDGIGYLAAGGDVDVAGSSTYTRSDGRSGIVADVTFSTGARIGEQRVLNSSSGNVALAAAIAASGIAAAAASAPPQSGEDGQERNWAATAALVGSPIVEQHSEADETAEAAVSKLVSDSPGKAILAELSTGSDSWAPLVSHHDIDNGEAHAAVNSIGPSSNEDEGPPPSVSNVSLVAPAISMPSAEAMQAAGFDNNAQAGGSVEKIVAEVLSHADAQTVDFLFANLPGGNTELPEVSQFASKGSIAGWGAGVPGIDTSGAHPDLQITMDIATFHHDAVQPAING